MPRAQIEEFRFERHVQQAVWAAPFAIAEHIASSGLLVGHRDPGIKQIVDQCSQCSAAAGHGVWRRSRDDGIPDCSPGLRPILELPNRGIGGEARI